MAQIDPSIAMGFRPIQIESPVNQMAAISQLQSAQQQQQMNALKMQEYQRARQEENELARIMGNKNLEFGSEPFMREVLAKAPSMYEGIATRAAQRENLLAQREAREAETQKRQFEAKKLEGQLSKEQLQASLSELASYTSVEDARSALEQKVSAGALTREQADKLQQGLPVDDAGMPAWQIRTMRGLLTPSEMLQDVRAEKKDIREEKRLGFEETRLENEAARLKLEDARIQEQTRHANAMESIGRAGADRAALQAEETARHNKAMERLRAAEINKPSAIAAPTVTMVIDPNDNTRMLSVDAKVYKGGSLGSPGVIGIAGKEPMGARKAEAKEIAQENAGNTIALLRQNFDQLDKLGGITSTQNRPGTNVGAYLSTTGAGQLTGRIFGTEAQSERNKIAQTRPLLMTQIMSALGLSAKQLDSNAELKLWLSAATDPTLDLESNKAALDNLESLLAGKGKAKPGASSAKPAPKSDVRSKADAILGQ
jgi:hypothetical protein